MSRNRWHMRREGDALVLSRQPGARSDLPGLWAETALPGALRPGVLAHEIRKDVWRALQDLRGFSPVIELRPCARTAGIRVRAGGTVLAHVPASLQQRLSDVLEHPVKRARWISHAGRSAA